jgi:sugar/nucleoside kinase (ribokinase family)
MSSWCANPPRALAAPPFAESPSRMRITVVGPSSWNHIIALDALPERRPHMQFARDSWWTVGGTSAGKALHLLDLGVDVTLVTPIGADRDGEALHRALAATGVTVVALPTDVTESHTNLMAGGERVSLYTSVPSAPSAQDMEQVRRAATHADALVLDLSALGRASLALAAAGTIPVWTDLHDWDGVAAYHLPFAAVASTVVLSDDGGGDRDAIMMDAIARGATLAVRTCGERGAVAVDADGNWHRAGAVPARVVDTNGAGDGFFSGALVAKLAGASVPGILEAGARQACRALTSRHLSPVLD